MISATGRDELRGMRLGPACGIVSSLERNLPLHAEHGRHLRVAHVFDAMAPLHQETALAAGAAAVGLSEVVAALSEARVAVLVYDPNVRYQGRLGADGSFHAGGAARAGTGSVVHEPRLPEPIAARCLRIGARVMPSRARRRTFCC